VTTVEDKPELASAPRAILIQDFADVALPLRAIRGRFLDTADWLAPLASAAQDEGESVILRVGPAWAPEGVTREVRVSLGLVHFRNEALVIPLSWESVGLRSLFPVLDGQVEVAPLGDDSSRLTFSGSYTPPGGGLGARLDRALLHRVATSTVRSFLNNVAASLQVRSET